MFTGLIETLGEIVAVETRGNTRLTVAAPGLAHRWRVGDSIAVNGVCLTALATDAPERFAADLAAETVERTTLGALPVGSVVNLELPTPAGSPLGGHVVQGHVDATGRLELLQPLHEDLETTDWRLTIEAPARLAGQIVSQGSITVDGISLTVARLYEAHPDGSLRFEVAIIPHTYRSTHLHTLATGAAVNLETDVLARYAAAQAAAAGSFQGTEVEWLTTRYLLARGY